MKMIFLVDGDNNIGTGLQGADQLTAEDSVLVFYQKTGLALGKIKELCKGSPASIQYLESVKGGKNSIDFQIITELGVLVGRGEADCAYVISQDKGYEAAMSALRARYAGAFREVALRPSIAACLKSSFLMRANTLTELKSSLSQQFGAVQGAMAYRHLEELFKPAKKAAAQKAAEKPAELQPAEKTPKAPAAQKAAVKAEAPAASEKAAEKPGVKKSRSRRRTVVKSPEQKPVEAATLEALEKQDALQPVPAPPPADRPADEAAAEMAAEKAAAKAGRPHRGGRRKKKPADKPSAE